MFSKQKFKIFDQFSIGVFVLDKKREIKYYNDLAKSFVTDHANNTLFIKALENGNKFIYHEYLLEKEIYDDGNYFIIFVKDISALAEKMHDIRHDVKNLLNPLTLLQFKGIDTKTIIRDVSNAVDRIEPKILFEQGVIRETANRFAQGLAN